MTAQVMGQPEARIVQLALAGPALQLQIQLVEHAQPRGADGMAETLEAAVDLARDLTCGIEIAVQHRLPCFTFISQTQIFHGHQFRNAEAVMHLGGADFPAWILDAGLLIGPLGGDAGGFEMGAVPVVEGGLLAVGHTQL